jgi:DNA helicase II / ATP-dependent DNA helicase PcrA
VQQQSRQGDRNVFAARTRFIPADILDRFEIRTAGGGDRTPIGSKTATITPVDLASRARERWRA